MAASCHFWRMTPAEYWSLTLEEHREMNAFVKRYIDEQKRASDGR